MDISGKKITIVREDNVIGVDGIFLGVDCSSLPENLRVVQWSGDHAEVELTDRDNTHIQSLDAYNQVLDLWQSKKDFNDAKALDPLHGLNESEVAQREYDNSLQAIKDTFAAEANAPVEVEGIAYNGGEDSARAINDAVSLAGVLGETSCYIAGLDNVARDMSFPDALNVAAQIGKAWRTAYFKMQLAKVALTQGA